MPYAIIRDVSVGGALVREKRKERGLDQVDLATACDTSVATISRFERGISTPQSGTIRAIASVLRLSLDELLPEESP